MKSEDIEIRSEEIRDLLSGMPSWLIRRGIMIFFLVLIGFMSMSWFVRYPDIVRAPVELNTRTLPASVSMRESGNLSYLHVQEGESVEKNQVLMELRSEVSLDAVSAVRKGFETFKKELNEGKRSFPAGIAIYENINLGEVQNAYSNWVRQLEAYRFFENHNFYAQKIRRLEEQIQTQRTMQAQLEKQQQLLQQKYEIASTQFKTDKTLFEEEVIAKNEFLERKKVYVDAEYALESMRMTMLEQQVLVQQLERSITEVEQIYAEQRSDVWERLRQSTSDLEAAFQAWDLRYVVRAPMAGRVSFFELPSSGQFVEAGKELLTILPDSSAIRAYAYVNAMGVGKVSAGQRVRISLNDYAPEEFGLVEGVVLAKSPRAREGQYLVTIALPEGLYTNYNKSISFSQQMQGEAMIETEDLRLIQRIFYQFKYFWEFWS
ncbi:MAG: HlyD family efflux transporter periplasmic adaptor subunit [Bernardetiaceae bacterium]|nr:HlyD family efflux transporter periplasmic adaptor subunit [Bernardetiaceae bacterium]